jgi:hypothetical protein
MFLFINKFSVTLKSNQHTATLTTQAVIINDVMAERREEETIKSNLNAVSLFNWTGTHAHK